MSNFTAEQILQAVIDSGVDLSSYRKSPTQVVVPMHLAHAAIQILESNRDKHEIKVDFNDPNS